MNKEKTTELELLIYAALVRPIYNAVSYYTYYAYQKLLLIETRFDDKFCQFWAILSRIK